MFQQVQTVYCGQKVFLPEIQSEEKCFVRPMLFLQEYVVFTSSLQGRFHNFLVSDPQTLIHQRLEQDNTRVNETPLEVKMYHNSSYVLQRYRNIAF